MSALAAEATSPLDPGRPPTTGGEAQIPLQRPRGQCPSRNPLFSLTFYFLTLHHPILNVLCVRISCSKLTSPLWSRLNTIPASRHQNGVAPFPALQRYSRERDGDKAPLCYSGLVRSDRGMIISSFVLQNSGYKAKRDLVCLVTSTLSCCHFCWFQSQVEATIWKDIDDLKVFKVLDLDDFQKTFSAYQKPQVYQSAWSPELTRRVCSWSLS